MDECKHSWWCCPNERFKSNPEKIVAACSKCEITIMIKVVDHWSQLESAMENDFHRKIDAA